MRAQTDRQAVAVLRVGLRGRNAGPDGERHGQAGRAATRARAFVGDMEKTKGIFRKALRHRGYALVDVFQPCVTFNKVNTYEWFKENTYHLGDDHDPRDREGSLRRALESEKLPLGLFYLAPDRPTFEETTGLYGRRRTPLHARAPRTDLLKKIMMAQ